MKLSSLASAAPRLLGVVALAVPLLEEGPHVT